MVTEHPFDAKLNMCSASSVIKRLICEPRNTKKQNLKKLVNLIFRLLATDLEDFHRLETSGGIFES